MAIGDQVIFYITFHDKKFDFKGILCKTHAKKDSIFYENMIKILSKLPKFKYVIKDTISNRFLLPLALKPKSCNLLLKKMSCHTRFYYKNSVFLVQPQYPYGGTLF